MRVRFRQLKKDIVQTASGVTLGNVVDIEMDTEGQMVVNYHVKRSMLGGEVNVINREQVVRFEEGKIVVDDNVAKEYARQTEEKKMAGTPEPVAMRQIES